MGFQGKMIFVKFQDSIVPHISQFLGQGAAVQIQIIASCWRLNGMSKEELPAFKDWLER